VEVYFLILLILLMVAALSSGFPVAFALPGSAILTIAIAAICGYLFLGDTDAFFSHGGPNQWLSAGVTNLRSLYWEVERDTLIAIPLFVFMGIMLQKSQIAEDLLVAMAQLFGPVPGGLGISVVFVGALLAATTGIVGATVIAMGLISLPAMLRNNYSKPLACGTICASGTLGQIIPPSIVLIILADQLSSAADQANTTRKAEYREITGEYSMPGDFDVVSASAGDMFMGAFIPGLILVGIYMAYIFISAMINPKKAPPVPYDGAHDREFFTKVLLSLVPPLLLIFVVLGSIIMGIATVNQAGAVGAIGALLMGSYRLAKGSRDAYMPAILALVAVLGLAMLVTNFDLNIKNVKSQADQMAIYAAIVMVGVLLVGIGWALVRAYRTENVLNEVMVETAKTTSMVFIILLGAAMLTSAFRAFGGEELVKEYLTGLPGGFWVQFLVVMLVIFLLGFFLDFIEIAVVVVPIVAPILLADPSANVTAVWLGVMVGLNIQTSFLTPPFGFALFYLRGVAPKVVKTVQIYKGAVAFIALQLLGLAIAGLFPSLINYLPNRSYLTSDTAPPPNNPRIQACLEEMVFPRYAEQRQDLERALNDMRRVNIDYLPDNYRENLQGSYQQMAGVFAAVDKVQQAEVERGEFSVEYAPLHYQVRALQQQMRDFDDEIDALKQDVDRIRFSEQPDNERKGRLNARIDQINQEKAELEAQIPEVWTAQRAEFNRLSKQEKTARLKYRNLVDEGYQVILDTRLMAEGADALQRVKPEIEELHDVIRNAQPDEAIEQINAVESRLSEIKNAHPVKSSLSKARRALKRGGDRDKASGFLVEALSILDSEVEWRGQAAQQLLPRLSEFDAAIRDTIGLRLQPRLTIDQAESVASCLSHHRDLSLSF